MSGITPSNNPYNLNNYTILPLINTLNTVLTLGADNDRLVKPLGDKIGTGKGYVVQADVMNDLESQVT